MLFLLRPFYRTGLFGYPCVFLLLLWLSVALSGCNPVPYSQTYAEPPTIPNALNKGIELTGDPSSLIQNTGGKSATLKRQRTFVKNSQTDLAQLVWSPFSAMFNGQDDPSKPPGVRGSADHSWRDDGNGAAPNHWTPVGFNQLPGWSFDRHEEALMAFLRSCESIRKKSSSQRMGEMSYSGYAGQWQQLCAQAASTPMQTAHAKAFFETHFQPYKIAGPGKFTGYYEASLNGSKTRNGRYQWPLYRKPNDLVIGQLYFDRAQIDAGVLSGRNLELLWIDNPIDIFFLQIQGSGIVHLDDGTKVRVGYAGNNGHPFRGIRPALVAKGYDPEIEGLTIQAYRNWLLDSSVEIAREVMNYNPRYIFFDFNDAPAARGDGGTLLTPQRSMAVDKDIIPLHVPLWVTTNVPGPNGQGQVDVARLMIAQDTGIAIKGEIRGDYYWGSGEEAFSRAGRMAGRGTYRVLLPKFISIRGAL